MLDARTPEDLAAWSHAWVEERGRPIITTELTLSGRQDHAAWRSPSAIRIPSRGLVWNQRIKVAIGGSGGK